MKNTLKKQYPNHNKNWSKQEEKYITSHYGEKTINTMSKKLGRKPSSVRRKLTKLGNVNFGVNIERVDTNYLSSLSGYERSTIVTWIKRRGLKSKKVCLYTKNDRKRQHYIKEKDFWNWCKKNRDTLDFSKFNFNFSPMIPDWAKEEQKNFERCKKNLPVNISKKEKEDIIELYLGRASKKSISEITGRSLSSVLRIIKKEVEQGNIPKVSPILRRMRDDEVARFLAYLDMGFSKREIMLNLNLFEMSPSVLQREIKSKTKEELERIRKAYHIR